MVGFFDLPQEVRDMIYTLVFDANIKLVFVPGLQYDSARLERHPVAAFLVCSKQIFAECIRKFLANVRLDVTYAVDKRTGAFPATATAIIQFARNIKVKEYYFTGDVLKKLVKSLLYLEVLTYESRWNIYVRPEDGSFSPLSDIDDNLSGDEDSQLSNRYIRESIREDARAKAQSLVGQCNCDCEGFVGTNKSDCSGEGAIRRIIAAWDWNDQPFKLVGLFDVDYDYGSKLYCELDLGTEMMTVFSHKRPGGVIDLHQVSCLEK